MIWKLLANIKDISLKKSGKIAQMYWGSDSFILFLKGTRATNRLKNTQKIFNFELVYKYPQYVHQTTSTDYFIQIMSYHKSSLITVRN